jgi:hypothetical protein
MSIEWEAGLEWVAYKGWMTERDLGVPSRAMDPGFQERRCWIYGLLCGNEVTMSLGKIVGFDDDPEERPYKVGVVVPKEDHELFAFSLIAPISHDQSDLVQAIEAWIRHNHRNVPMPVIVIEMG